MKLTGKLCRECKIKKQIVDDMFDGIEEESKMIVASRLFVRFEGELMIRYSIACEKCGLNHRKYRQTLNQMPKGKS